MTDNDTPIYVSVVNFEAIRDRLAKPSSLVVGCVSERGRFLCEDCVPGHMFGEKFFVVYYDDDLADTLCDVCGKNLKTGKINTTGQW